MSFSALVLFDQPDRPDGLVRLRIPNATYGAIEHALRQASHAGGLFLKILLFEAASRRVVFAARTRQRSRPPSPPQSKVFS